MAEYLGKRIEPQEVLARLERELTMLEEAREFAIDQFNKADIAYFEKRIMKVRSDYFMILKQIED